MIAPDGQAKVGPFFDAKLLDALLSEITLRYGFAALVFALHLEDVSEAVQRAKLDYTAALQAWRDKYLPGQRREGFLVAPLLHDAIVCRRSAGRARLDELCLSLGMGGNRMAMNEEASIYTSFRH